MTPAAMLARWGYHDGSCEIRQDAKRSARDRVIAPSCTCGFDAAHAEAGEWARLATHFLENWFEWDDTGDYRPTASCRFCDWWAEAKLRTTDPQFFRTQAEHTEKCPVPLARRLLGRDEGRDG